MTMTAPNEKCYKLNGKIHEILLEMIKENPTDIEDLMFALNCVYVCIFEACCQMRSNKYFELYEHSSQRIMSHLQACFNELKREKENVTTQDSIQDDKLSGMQ